MSRAFSQHVRCAVRRATSTCLFSEMTYHQRKMLMEEGTQIPKRGGAMVEDGDRGVVGTGTPGRNARRQHRKSGSDLSFRQWMKQ